MQKTTTIAPDWLDIENRTISGYFATFNEYDLENDRFFKGCFQRSIDEWGPEATGKGRGKIKFYYNHSYLSHNEGPIGIIKEIHEDDTGLFAKCQFGKWANGERAFEQCKAGAINEGSFLAKPINTKFNPRRGRDAFNTKLYELSVVDFAVNEGSKMMKKSFDHSFIKDMMSATRYLKDKDLKERIQRGLLMYADGGSQSEELVDQVDEHIDDHKSGLAKADQVNYEQIIEQHLQKIASYEF